jgi:transcriptional regulator with XRE-family HTH domain
MATDGKIIEALREAREQKGLSQRALSQLVGMPQSHISKIESGQVDLQLSSLTELARVLELELRLVPRRAIPAVDSIVRTVAPSTNDEAQARIADDLRRLAARVPAFDSGTALTRYQQLSDTLHFLQHVTIPAADLAAAQKAIDTLLKRVDAGELAEPPSQKAVKSAADTLRLIRNRLAHPTAQPTTPRPAYQLDEEDDDA